MGKRLFLQTLIYIAAFTHCTTLYAQEGVRMYTIDTAKSTIAIDARSTLHPIKVDANEFGGEFTFASEKEQITVEGDATVEIESLVSGNRGLDRNMYKMFRSKKYPQALCRVESMVFDPAQAKENEPVTAVVKAVLTLKDVSKPFESEVMVTPADNGFIVRGSTVVSLKGFKLRAPTFLGFIRMYDEITVNFDIFITPSQES